MLIDFIDNRPKIFRIFSTDNHLNEDFKKYNFVFPDAENIFERLERAFSSLPIDDFSEKEYELLDSEITKTILNNPDIKGVFLGYDLEAFLTLIFFKKLKITNIKLPSLDSFYQLFNKVYQKKLDDSPLKYSYFDIFDNDWHKHLLKFPFYIKPAIGSGGLHNYIINNIDELKSIIPVLRNEIPKQDGFFNYFAKKYLDLEKFPLASKHIMVCEELVEGFTNVSIDAFVDEDGNIKNLIWADQITRNNSVLGYSFPSQFPKNIISKAKEMGEKIIKKANLRNSVYSIEFFVKKDGFIKIIEVNPRSSLYFNLNYNHFNVPYTDIAINLSMGKETKIPDLNKLDDFSTQLHLTTKKTGKIKDILSLENLHKIEKLKKYFVINTIFYAYDEEDTIENNFFKNGIPLAIVFFKSLSEMERNNEINFLQNYLLKN